MWFIKWKKLVYPYSCILVLMSSGFISVPPVFCASSVYYIDSNALNASDLGSGTLSQPWKSLDPLKNRTFSPGDTVCFAKGSSYFGGVTITSSGTAEAPIVMTSYGSGNAPSFSNSDPHDQNGNVFQINGDCIIIDGLYFHDGAESMDTETASVLKVGDVYINQGANHVTIQNCEFFNSPVGIHTNGEYTLITRNALHDCNRALAPPGWGPIAVIISNANSEISYNRCTNYIRTGGDYGADGGFLEVDPRYYGQSVTGLKIHHNYSYGNEGFLEIEGSDSRNGNITVSYNFSNDYQEFVFFWSGKNCLVENNTVLRVLPKNSVTDVVFSFRYSGNTIRNNIFVVNGGKQVFSNNGTETWGFGANYSGQTHNNNLYYSIDGSESDPIGLPAGNGETSGDPKFVNYPADCHLKSESPAINAGVNLGYTKDFDDNPVPSGETPDIGAFEFQQGTGSSPSRPSSADFFLHQNYPNPFNPATTISYRLPESSHVRLAVFNVAGQWIETLADEEKPAGEYSVDWKTGGAAQGIYFYRLTAEKFVSTRKMVVLN